MCVGYHEDRLAAPQVQNSRKGDWWALGGTHHDVVRRTEGLKDGNID